MLFFLIFPLFPSFLLHFCGASLTFTATSSSFAMRSASFQAYFFKSVIQFNEEIANYDSDRYILLKFVNVDNTSQIYLKNYDRTKNLTLGVEYKYAANQRDILLLSSNETIKFSIENLYTRAYYKSTFYINAYFYKSQGDAEYLKNISLSYTTKGYQWGIFVSFISFY